MLPTGWQFTPLSVRYDAMLLIFLSSGFFLGWSLGANDAANVFGTAVGTRMLRFKTAAITASIFVIIGAVASGAGATHTLGKLGSVDALAGAFVVTLSAGLTVFWMTRLGIPVSTSQAIVGAIIGWNLFSGSDTDMGALNKIVLTWVLCPVLAAIFAVILFAALRGIFGRMKLHLLRLDLITRIGLLVVGAFGAFSLGANNIANVMGVFVPIAPFPQLNILGLFTLSGAQILFLLGGIAIAAGVLTYSHKVMETVGGSLLKLSPQAAFVVVLAQSLVLFLFASAGLEQWLKSHGLPAFPLVPVSSSQAVIGAVIGIGLLKGGRSIKYRVLGEIATGWVTTPLIAAAISFTALFFVQNVFDREVYHRTRYQIDAPVLAEIQRQGLPVERLRGMSGREWQNVTKLRGEVTSLTGFDRAQRDRVVELARVTSLYIDPEIVFGGWRVAGLSAEQLKALEKLAGHSYSHDWQLLNELAQLTPEWQLRLPPDIHRLYNEELAAKQTGIIQTFTVQNE
jgi:PiT family inorganic phosphate transporter